MIKRRSINPPPSRHRPAPGRRLLRRLSSSMVLSTQSSTQAGVRSGCPLVAGGRPTPTHPGCHVAFRRLGEHPGHGRRGQRYRPQGAGHEHPWHLGLAHPVDRGAAGAALQSQFPDWGHDGSYTVRGAVQAFSLSEYWSSSQSRTQRPPGACMLPWCVPDTNWVSKCRASGRCAPADQPRGFRPRSVDRYGRAQRRFARPGQPALWPPCSSGS